ncbi:IclR family transcriptional regulator [Salarchaeum sp. III]|uniref:IclR family transcriptional regulator n=1 Tax=Salarchaeum sp. III TaxID=3107927 RepID=UPI002ED847CE
MTADPSDTGLPVQAVGRTFDIINHLRTEGASGVTAVADGLALPKSTVHGYLDSLERGGYVVRDDGEYRLSLQFLDLGDYARSRYGLYETVKPEVDDLVAELGERAQVMVEEAGQGVYIYQTTGENAIQTDSHIGTTVNLHTTAVGKAYLAFQPEERRESFIDGELAQVTERSLVDTDALREELAEVREQGYAFNMEEKLDGMRAVGAPILDDDGVSTAAISVSGPTTRFNGSFLTDDLPQRMSQVAKVVSVKTAYS